MVKASLRLRALPRRKRSRHGERSNATQPPLRLWPRRACASVRGGQRRRRPHPRVWSKALGPFARRRRSRRCGRCCACAAVAWCAPFGCGRRSSPIKLGSITLSELCGRAPEGGSLGAGGGCVEEGRMEGRVTDRKTFRVRGSGCRVWGVECRRQGGGAANYPEGPRVSGCRVQGPGLWG